MEFTQKQKLAIAEFLHAYETDTLIKPEAEKLISVFQEHSVPEAYVANLEIDDCCDLIINNTTADERSEIMALYYSGKL